MNPLVWIVINIINTVIWTLLARMQFKLGDKNIGYLNAGAAILFVVLTLFWVFEAGWL